MAAHGAIADPSVRLEEPELALDEVAQQVDLARSAMRALLRTDPTRAWSASHLQEAAGQGADWSASILSLAFWRLVEDLEIRIDDDLRVHVNELR
jgi:hypothetical protein